MTQIRISVANICRFAITGGQKVGFGVLNPNKLARGEKFVQALGGGINLTAVGKSSLEKKYQAAGFECDEHSGFYDARFRASLDFLDQIWSFFKARSQADFELTIDRELHGELYKTNYSGIGTIFGPGVPFPPRRFVGACQQPVPSDGGGGTSSRAQQLSVPTRRLFFLWDLFLGPGNESLFFESPAVVRLTPEELATTNGGRQKGVTSTGVPIADNLGVGLDL